MTDYDKNISTMSEKPNVEETPVKTRERKTKTLFEKDRQAFFSDLLRFHENRGTPIARIPKIPGCKIDLHQLYQSIITRGGWLKVNSKNEWEEVLKEVGFPAKCVNSEIALKHIYIRYFDKYERYNFHGENEREKIDEDDDDNTSNRHKRWSAKSLHYVPQNYNYNHHNINESSRANLKLSTDLFYASEYDKLVMSLLSPLPNEQDFAINVCTLMSNECKQTLKINKCPRLIFALLAHAGIFDHYAIRDMFTEFYTQIRKHPQQQFWKDLLYEKPDILELLYVDFYDNEEIYLNPKKCEEFFKKDKEQDGSEANEYHFLSLGRGLGTHDYIGSRILQIISILRNLSFNEENILVLARHRTLLRFLIMSANIRWSNVHHYSLDILGNIGNELDLKDPFADIITRQLFGTVCDGLESDDRGVIISCLEILSKIAQKESNEEFLCKYLRKKTYQQIGLFLTIKDLMLIIYTLECIYALTSIGEKPCNSFVDIHGVLDSLVSLVTVEAHSFGPDACILMKVVETIPSGRNYQQIQNIRQNLNMNQQIQQPVQQPVQQIHIPHIVEQPRTPPRFVVQSMESPVKIDPNNIAQKHNQQQILQENEQFALAWLRATFELSANMLCRIEEQELYRMYIGASSKVGRKGVLSPQHFPRCVRSVFGGTIGPNPSKEDEKTFYYTGIKLRIHAAERTATNVVTSSDNQMKQEIVIVGPKNSSAHDETVQKHIVTSVSSSPLLQQVLSTNPADKNVTVSHMNQTIVSSSSHVVMAKSVSQDTSCPVPGLTQAPTTTTASSLIKSLLANKVTSQETNTTASVNSCLVTSNASNVHQVAQRQQLQQQTKQKQLNEQIQQQQQQLPVTTMIQTVNQMVQQKPLMVTTNNQSLTNIKIGSSTISIKPGTLPNNTVITANPIPMDKHETIIKTTTVEPPPLAPLSIQTNKIDPNKVLVAANISSASQKITANKMLVDLLDKKALEPPVFPSLEKTVTLKRKIDGSTEEIPAKKADTDNIVDANPNAKAADLYAKLAGSILEDEEMEEDDGLKLIEKKVEPSKPASQIINTTPVPMQRQIIMTPNNQVILSPGAGTPTATIKTDSGIQTVPILLQNNSLHMQQGIQGQFIQQVQPQSAPTQYILATNNQGQTYVVAQQQAPQTVLLAQTPQQQGTPTKTIIILQQQPQQQLGSNNTTIQQIAGGLNVAPQSSQKIIMTPHGQQVIVTQVPRQFHTQQQVIQGYQQTNVLPSNTSIIQGQSSGMGNRKIIITNTGNTMEVDANKPTENQQTQQILKQFTTASGTKIIQTMQPQQVYQQPVPTSQVNTMPTQIQTKIIQGTSQQAIQTIQQGQNIIVQKGQKFQIGNTQISQIIQQPQQTQIVQQNPTTPQQQQQQQQQIIIQKTIKVDQLQQPVGQPQQQQQQTIIQPQMIQNQPTQTQIVHLPHGNVTISESQVMMTETKTVQQSTMQQHPPQQQPALIPTTIQHHNVTVPISQAQQQQPTVSEASNQSAPKNPEESHKKSEESTDQPATSTSAGTGQTQTAPVKTFSIQIPVPAGAQSGAPQHTVKVIPAMDPNKIVEEDVDPNWLYVCDWRGCPKKKFASANEVYLHACAVHCPHIDGNPDIYCQWGAGNSLCDNLPRKRFSLMTHIYDRHCNTETFKAAVQKRLALLDNPPTVKQPYPVTLVRMPAQSGSTSTPESAVNLQNGPTTIQNAGTAAMHAIKRHSSDYINSKELLDDPEGPVTKSIRLTASLILRNLVNYSHGAKRALKYHESHLASIALSNVESSRTIAQVLYEMNDAHPV